MHDYLEERRIFAFDEVRGLIEERHAMFAAGAEDDVREVVRRLVYLGSAELAVTETSAAIEYPVRVSAWAAEFALHETDCSPWDVHRPRADQLWNLAAFSGDVGKLKWLMEQRGIGGPDELWEGFDDVVDEFIHRFEEAQGHHQFWSREAIALRGVTWKARLGVLLERQDAREALDAYLDRFQRLPA